MKEIVIDCSRIDGPREFHFVLAKQLDFPEWYGNNLDALHDILTGICENTHLRLMHFPAFASGFRRVLEDAEKDSEYLTVTIC